MKMILRSLAMIVEYLLYTSAFLTFYILIYALLSYKKFFL